MASESDSEHDADESRIASVASSDDCFDAATRAGNASSADTRADTIEWIASIRDIHFAWNEPERAPEPSRWSDDEWLLPLKRELHKDRCPCDFGYSSGFTRARRLAAHLP